MSITNNCPHQAYCDCASRPTCAFISHLTRNTFAIILAGARQPPEATHRLPLKPAVPFAGKFRIIDFTLSNCVNSGIRKIGVATQYKAHSLIRHIQRGWSFLDGVSTNSSSSCRPSSRSTKPSGTRAPPTRCTRTCTSCAATTRIRPHRRRRPHLQDGLRPHAGLPRQTPGRHDRRLHRRPPRRRPRIRGDGRDGDDRVVEFVEKPDRPPALPGRPDRALASMGIYIFNAAFLFEQLQRDALVSGSSRDFGRTSSPHRSPLPRLRPPFRRFLRRHDEDEVPTGATSAPSTPTGRRTWK